MSEVMDHGIIGMPFDMAMESDLSRRQFYSRAQAVLAERDGANERAGLLLKAKNDWADRARAAEAGRAQLRAEVEALLNGMTRIMHATSPGDPAFSIACEVVGELGHIDAAMAAKEVI